MSLLFRRLLPKNENLVQDLLLRARLSPKLRSHQLELRDFGALTSAFIDICQEKNLSVTPLPIKKRYSV